MSTEAFNLKLLDVVVPSLCPDCKNPMPITADLMIICVNEKCVNYKVVFDAPRVTVYQATEKVKKESA